MSPRRLRLSVEAVSLAFGSDPPPRRGGAAREAEAVTAVNRVVAPFGAWTTRTSSRARGAGSNFDARPQSGGPRPGSTMRGERRSVRSRAASGAPLECHELAGVMDRFRPRNTRTDP